VNFLLRLAAAYVDAVLKTFYPLKQEPSIADLDADALADKEAEEEVWECRGFGGGHWHAPAVPNVTEADWPEKPDPLGHLIALVEDIRNLLQSPRVSEAAAEPPDTSWIEMTRNPWK
jgi:hypothetical protein